MDHISFGTNKMCFCVESMPVINYKLVVSWRHRLDKHHDGGGGTGDAISEGKLWIYDLAFTELAFRPRCKLRFGSHTLSYATFWGLRENQISGFRRIVTKKMIIRIDCDISQHFLMRVSRFLDLGRLWIMELKGDHEFGESVWIKGRFDLDSVA